MTLAPYLADLLQGKNLNERASYDSFLLLYRGKIAKPSAKALLLLLARKGETAEEVLGCLKALRRLEPAKDIHVPNLMDTCGTGGDSSQSLNISTLAALILAAAGGRVAKHGNRSLSSQCGSSDLMEAFGVKLDCPPNRMTAAIRRCGMGYFHAPFYHPVFAKVRPLRREIKTRTIFNLLGPLVNPLKIQRQLVGVSDPGLLAVFAKILKRQKIKRALVCHGEDGLDEISLTAPTRLAWVDPKKIKFERIRPEKFGLAKASRKNLKGGTVKKNLSLAVQILKGKLRGPLRDGVALNAAFALLVSGKIKSAPRALWAAGEILDSGKAYEVWQALKRISRER